MRRTALIGSLGARSAARCSGCWGRRRYRGTLWRSASDLEGMAEDVRIVSIDSGPYIAEEKPEALVEALTDFLTDPERECLKDDFRIRTNLTAFVA